jgi:hypothetical protein
MKGTLVLSFGGARSEKSAADFDVVQKYMLEEKSLSIENHTHAPSHNQLSLSLSYAHRTAAQTVPQRSLQLRISNNTA